MQYEYTQTNRLETPHKYQFSPYGQEFISAYKTSREDSRKGLPVAEKLDAVLEHEFETDTAQKVKELIQDPDDETLGRYIKKYEVTKKLWNVYSADWKKASDDYSDPSQYLLLSLSCLLRYRETKNLKMLNTALKLNDLLCSIELDDDTKPILALCLDLEKEVVSELYSSLSVDL